MKNNYNLDAIIVIFRRVNIHFLSTVYKNCADLLLSWQANQRCYTINPDNGVAFEVFCDQNSAVGVDSAVQKRLDGSVDFNCGWDDYKQGFGNLYGEFWFGQDSPSDQRKKQASRGF